MRCTGILIDNGPPEAQGIQGPNDPTAHAVDIAHNAADSRGGAFDGHDLAGMVMGFMGQDDAVAFAINLPEIDDTGILHRPDHHVGCLGGQVGLQVRPAALVGTVLAPHSVEQGQFGQGRIATQKRADLAGLIRSHGQTAFLQIGTQGLIIEPFQGNGRKTLVRGMGLGHREAPGKGGEIRTGSHNLAFGRSKGKGRNFVGIRKEKTPRHIAGAVNPIGDSMSRQGFTGLG